MRSHYVDAGTVRSGAGEKSDALNASHLGELLIPPPGVAVGRIETAGSGQCVGFVFQPDTAVHACAHARHASTHSCKSPTCSQLSPHCLQTLAHSTHRSSQVSKAASIESAVARHNSAHASMS